MTSVSAHYRDRPVAIWPWLPLWLLVALVAIFMHGPMPLYSTRTLAVAWDMWNHGQWLVPHLNGQPYSEKAPLLFWLIHVGWAVFGVNDAWPRVLEVGFGATELVLATVLAKRLFSDQPWVARVTPWMLMALVYAFMFGLQIMYDVLLATWVLGALVCLVPKPGRSEPRWLLFAACIGFGLLTKGPVMLLHVAFPFLLGPLWSTWARDHRARWYGRGVLAVVMGLAILACWVVPASIVGGPAYRHKLLFTQTLARVVHETGQSGAVQAHARPWWWYFSRFPAILFPFFFWPRAWVAVGALRRPLAPGLRFCLCWLLPMLATLSLISGKQAYYPLPELVGFVLLLAGAVAALHARHSRLARNGWLGTWILAVAGLALAAFLFALPVLIAHGVFASGWAKAAAQVDWPVAAAFLVLGLLLFWRRRDEVRHLALVSLISALMLNLLFTLVLWPRYDITPTARLLHEAELDHRTVAYVGSYDGQFDFTGRLTRPIVELQRAADVAAFARQHANGLVITAPDKVPAAARHYAVLIQPFRSDWLVTWPAGTLAAIHSGQQPPAPAQPVRIIDAIQGAGGVRK